MLLGCCKLQKGYSRADDNKCLFNLGSGIKSSLACAVLQRLSGIQNKVKDNQVLKN